MKNSILLSLTFFLLTSNFIFSQDKFIELLVSDEYELEAEEIYYQVIFNPPIHKTKKSKKSNSNLEEIAFDFLSIDGVEENENVIKSPRMSEHFPLIKHLKIKDKQSLQQIQSAIGKYPNISGNITSLEHSKTESIFSDLTDKVVIKAKKKSDTLAKLMGAEMVEIVEVSLNNFIKSKC